MSESFYGTTPGKDFTIAKIFHNKKEMVNDLGARWSSKIQIGDIVIISYGMPNGPEFESNQNIDLGEYHLSYNSTLWQKIYAEDVTSARDELTGVETVWASDKLGLGYKLLASMTGNTPKLTFEQGVVPLDNDQPPMVEIDYTSPDNPIFTIYLPRAKQVEVVEDVTELNADQAPKVQDIGNVNLTKLKFSMPQNERLVVTPAVQVDPAVGPSAEYDNTGAKVNRPELTLSLPRAAKWYMGADLGDTGAEDGSGGYLPQTVAKRTNYGAGDYYVNMYTGYIYEITSVAENSFEAVYTGKLFAGIPSVTGNAVNPYVDNEGTVETVPPNLTSTPADPVAKEGWKINIDLPKLPEFAVDEDESSSAFCGADELGHMTIEATRQVPDKFNFIYDFLVPRGARIFVGTELTAADQQTLAIPGAMPGDKYLNTESGAYYHLGGSNRWTYQCNLTGPTGAPIKIGSETIQVSAATQVGGVNVTQDDASIGAYLDTIFPTDKPSDYEIVPVNYTDAASVVTSYYFSYKNGTWSSVIVTGNASNFISNEYKEADEHKAYSISYINGLQDNIATQWGSFTDLI